MTQPHPHHPEVDRLLAITDPAERAKEAHTTAANYQAAMNAVAQVRRDALEELVGLGLNHTEIGEKIGISRARVGQLLAAGPRPERAFLGGGIAITIAVGGKSEANRADDKPQTVVSSEASAAYQKLADLARGLGLKPNSPAEVVSPPGLINLNRPGLIVLCSPRLLPFVGQVLESDDRYAFTSDEQSWYLLDRKTDTKYRSPMDEGVHVDYAYLGRLPRPDGKGNFLYLAGVHSMGTLGAAQHIEDNLGELWKETKGKRFSQLIEVSFNPKTREVTGTKPLTELRRHEGVN